MIIVACSCGHAITGDDREAMIGATSEHLRNSPPAVTPTGAARDHSALIGEADAKITLTVAIEGVEFPSPIIPMSGTLTAEAEADLRERLKRVVVGGTAP